MKSILENRPELAYYQAAEVAGYLWQKGWRNVMVVI